MELELLLSFIGVSILLILMPGPDNIFVLLESLKNGSKTGILISIGLVLGVLGHTLIAATGLTIVIQKSDFLFELIKFAGAGYLLYLAYLELKEKITPIDTLNSEIGKENRTKLIRKGFFMNILNPKVSLFFIAFFPQFVSETGFHVSIQMVILGLIFMSLAFSIFSTVALLANQLTSYLQSVLFLKITKVVKVVTFCVLAVVLILSSR
ncbi:MAG: threonine/homoserine/homoserine lactone efflux protein [Crocinitomix sp.]|jgi:threonine/homoserine/homoserine lactone efflux protein